MRSTLIFHVHIPSTNPFDQWGQAARPPREYAPSQPQQEAQQRKKHQSGLPLNRRPTSSSSSSSLHLLRPQPLARSAAAVMAAAGLLPCGPLAVKAAASSPAERKPGPAGRRIPRSPSSNSSSSSSSSWWAPIFGFSAEPGYIGPADDKVAYPRKADAKPARCRPDPIRFTEEKARLLRLMTSDAASLHDPMYHSAIASRLASDFGDRTDL
ncbi:hypothetical protein NL676_035633 [Syzygium grande]|nr:hypothetical protein NL676_035633 [Syzygium grande]